MAILHDVSTYSRAISLRLNAREELVIQLLSALKHVQLTHRILDVVSELCIRQQ